MEHRRKIARDSEVQAPSSLDVEDYGFGPIPLTINCVNTRLITQPSGCPNPHSKHEGAGLTVLSNLVLF